MGHGILQEGVQAVSAAARGEARRGCMDGGQLAWETAGQLPHRQRAWAGRQPDVLCSAVASSQGAEARRHPPAIGDEPGGVQVDAQGRAVAAQGMVNCGVGESVAVPH